MTLRRDTAIGLALWVVLPLAFWGAVLWAVFR